MKLKTVIRENTWLSRDIIDFGWGNGYVIIPKEHPVFGKHYDEINVNVHYGLTYSEELTKERLEMFGLPAEDEGKWVIGFDTAHYGDTLEKWSKEDVQAETDRLMEQIALIK